MQYFGFRSVEDFWSDPNGWTFVATVNEDGSGFGCGLHNIKFEDLPSMEVIWTAGNQTAVIDPRF